MMKSSGKHFVATIFAIVLAIIVVLMECALRLAKPFSPTAYGYVQALIKNNPLSFGLFWLLIMAAAVYVAYVKYSERKTTGTLVALLCWLAIFLTMLAYGLIVLF